jgi:dTDP-4-dehydrorhamnose 3,5-epimerase
MPQGERMPFNITRLSIPDLILITPSVYEDQRGVFWESYKQSEFVALGLKEIFVQENFSKSKKNVLRGLHYQRSPKAQGKLVQVVEGEIFDVAVDLRKNSPTFGRWEGVTLSAQKQQQFFVPVGFAHGFCVLSPTAEVTYKVTEEYSPADDAGIIWNDPDLAISWPINDPILSKKDAALPRLKEVDRSGLF